MYFGDTIEEKRENYLFLQQKAAKLGKLFAILYGILAVIISISILSMPAPFFTKLILAILPLTAPLPAYWMGYFWYYGFLVTKSWMAKRGLNSGDVALAAGGGIAVSWLLGGRRSAQMASTGMLVIFLITLTIGFWTGMFQYFKVRSELRSVLNRA